jgi:hypothetical protein
MTRRSTAGPVVLPRFPGARRDRYAGRNGPPRILPDLHAAKLNNRLDDLWDDRDDPPLEQAAESFLSAHDDPRYRTGMDRLKKIAPERSRASWIADSTN